MERAALGVEGYLLEACGAYDIVKGDYDLKAFVAERAPAKIGVNMSEEIGSADGLSHAAFLELTKTLGEPWASRIVSAERLVSAFRNRRVATEIAAFAEAGELSKEIAERALSNEVITPGRHPPRGRGLVDAGPAPGPRPGLLLRHALRLRDRAQGDRGALQRARHPARRPPDHRLGRVLPEPLHRHEAHGLRAEGRERRRPPTGYQKAFDQAVKVREVIRRTIRPGRRADETLALLNQEVGKLPGFAIMKEFNKPLPGDTTDVIIGCHSVGNLGHGDGPSIAWFNPVRLTFPIDPTNLFSIEFFAYTPVPEWGGQKLRVPFEDDAMATERGIEWLYPVMERILLVG